jgi:hypothetical protein
MGVALFLRLEVPMAGSTLDPDTPGSRRRRNPAKGDPAEEAQRKEIAESAYYRAEKRGFEPGEEEKDWLEAEAEVKSRKKRR